MISPYVSLCPSCCPPLFVSCCSVLWSIARNADSLHLALVFGPLFQRFDWHAHNTTDPLVRKCAGLDELRHFRASQSDASRGLGDADQQGRALLNGCRHSPSSNHSSHLSAALALLNDFLICQRPQRSHL